jgi:hypothetical protein
MCCSIAMAISRIPLMPFLKREMLGGDSRTSADCRGKQQDRPCTTGHQLNSNQSGSGHGHATEGPSCATELDAKTYHCLATTSMPPS